MYDGGGVYFGMKFIKKAGQNIRLLYYGRKEAQGSQYIFLCVLSLFVAISRFPLRNRRVAATFRGSFVCWLPGP